MFAPPLKSTRDHPYPRRWAALGVLSTALLMIVAANTSLTVAVTDVQQKLGSTTTQSRWILDAYPLAVASLLLLFGGVGDRYGRRRALNIGLIGFAAASALGALSTTSSEVIGARALLGISGALIMPATLAYVRELFPPREAKKAFAIWSGSSGLALAIGPLAAGALIAPFGWTAVFWMDVPLALALLVLGAFTVPKSRNESAPRIDVLGAVLSTAVLAPLMYGIIEGDDKGWMSGTVLGAFAVALVALAAFVAWERHTPSPMLNLAWFRDRGFRMGSGLSVLGFTSVVGMLYIAVLFLQQDLLHSAFRTGAELMPLGAGILIGASVNNRIVARFGMRVSVIAGLLALTGGSAVVGFDQSGYLPVAVALAIVGLGAGAFLPTLSEAVMNGAPQQAGGVAGATADAAVELGSALGIAVLGSVLTTGYDDRLPASIHRLSGTAHKAVTDSLYGAHAVAAKLPATQGHALVHAANHAFLHGMSLAAIVAAGIALATAVIGIRMPRRASAGKEPARQSERRAVQALQPAAEGAYIVSTEPKHPSRLFPTRPGGSASRRRRWALASGMGAVSVACAVILPIKLASGSTQPATSSTSQSSAISQSQSATHGLDVLPFPGTPDASPSSQVTFPALKPSELKSVTVTGSHSGRHGGKLTTLPDNRGTTFTPDKSFAQGEKVTVAAKLSSPAAGTASGVPNATRLSYSFTVAAIVPVSAGAASTSSSSTKLPPTQSFASEPRLHPPTVSASSDPDKSSGDVFLTPEDLGPMILNSQGKLVWFDPIRGDLAFNLEVQRYEHQRVLTWWQGKVVDGHGTDGEDVILNRHYQPVAAIHAGEGYSSDLHEFTLTPHGTALVSAYQPVKANLSSIGGPRDGTVFDSIVQEVDIRTGRVVWEWHPLGHIPLSDSEAGKPSATSPYDFFHLNSIQELPDGNLLISSRNTWAVYEISRATGKVIWKLGGKESSFKMSSGTRFEWQHDARLKPNGAITLFDDAASPNEASQSRALELTLNTKKMTATLEHSYTHRAPLLATKEGSAESLANGDMFVGWGSEPDFSEYSSSGKQIFNGSFTRPVESYRAFRFKWSAQPATAPSVAVKAGKAGSSVVYASWNGATDVARWRLLGGSSPDKVSPLVEVAASGFQAAIPTKTSDRYVAVQALTSTGKVLGTSKAISR